MKIYVAHSSSFDYKTELYAPLRNSELNKKHQIVLPHEDSSKLYDSKSYLKECDLVIAEVSYPSTGQGIELGWANLYNVRIVCIHKSGLKPSSSLKAVSSELVEYDSSEDLINKLQKVI